VKELSSIQAVAVIRRKEKRKSQELFTKLFSKVHVIEEGNNNNIIIIIIIIIIKGDKHSLREERDDYMMALKLCKEYRYVIVLEGKENNNNNIKLSIFLSSLSQMILLVRST